MTPANKHEVKKTLNNVVCNDINRLVISFCNFDYRTDYIKIIDFIKEDIEQYRNDCDYYFNERSELSEHMDSLIHNLSDCNCECLILELGWIELIRDFYAHGGRDLNNMNWDDDDTIKRQLLYNWFYDWIVCGWNWDTKIPKQFRTEFKNTRIIKKGQCNTRTKFNVKCKHIIITRCSHCNDPICGKHKFRYNGTYSFCEDCYDDYIEVNK